MTGNVIVDKSKAFALQIIRLYQKLSEEHEFILARQVLKSGTSIGANVKEAVHGQSKPDFYAKMNVALKEAGETEYWLELLYEGGFIDFDTFTDVYAGCQELISLLTAVTKSEREEEE